MKDLARSIRQAFMHFCRRCLVLATGFGLFAGFTLLDTGRAYACASCICISVNHAITRTIITEEHGSGTFQTDPESLAYVTADVCTLEPGTRGWIAYEMCRHREEFIVFYWFKEHILAALMMMTEQLVSDAMLQMLIVGTFFDASHQLEVQRTFQELSARAHKDYHPSTSMCEIGTLARSLAASQRLGEFNAYSMSQHMQDRQMRNLAMASAGGTGQDIVHRWEQFKKTFCNPDDDNAQLGDDNEPVICEGMTLTSSYAPRNWDVDYGQWVGAPDTVTVDFSDTTDGYREHSLFALASNLYGNDVFDYFPESYFKDPRNHDDFMYLRAIVAKRSVAQNSFNNIIALKSQGSADSEDTLKYMAKALEQLGIDNEAERKKIIGGLQDDGVTSGTRPSYYAQMELLTKRLYQRPEFYTNLYDKPANVERVKAAMKALDLVQTMDLFKSKLRSEAALAVLTDLELQKEQELVQDRMNLVGDTGIR